MWIFMNNAMLSIVAHRDRPAALLVRARLRGDIERVFPEAQVAETPGADYRFRAVLPAGTVARVLAGAVAAIRYDNFKASVAEPRRASAYHDVWYVMLEEQQGQAREEAWRASYHMALQGHGVPEARAAEWARVVEYMPGASPGEQAIEDVRHGAPLTLDVPQGGRHE